MKMSRASVSGRPPDGNQQVAVTESQIRFVQLAERSHRVVLADENRRIGEWDQVQAV
jgi:hypothetical protein